jgi:hypothetical protein
MTLPTIDGHPLISGEVKEPLTGAWIGSFVADHDEDLTGSVTVELDGVEFVGTVRDSQVDNGKVTVRLVGGGGSLSKEADAGEIASKSYQGVSLATVLADIVSAAGETLASDATSLATTRVRNWQRSRGPYRRALEAVVTKAGLSWRVRRDGTLWLGTEPWPAVDEEGISEVEGTAADGFFGLRDAIAVRPGVTYQGNRIRQVTHSVDKGGTATTAWTKSANGALDALIEQLRRESDFDRPWACQVISQRDDYSLELLPDDDRIRGSGLDQILIAPGLPGIRAEVPGGARCYVEFVGGDPSLPRVTAWDAETALTLITVGASGSAEFVALANLVLAELQSVKSEFDTVKASLDTFATSFLAHVHSGVTTGPGSSGPTVTPGPSYTVGYSASSVAATKLKAE